MVDLTLRVNGKKHSLSVEDSSLLSETLRDQLNLTGTHIGCDTSQCGSCTIHMDRKAVKACTVLTAQAEGCEITTIEGIGEPGDLHPMQEAFREHHALQCGFCTPGMIMAAIGLVNESDELDGEQVRKGLDGNFCRCTGYHNIVKAVLDAKQRM
ncbi:MAG: (2Fe-2S)-binding protein [Gammaproteobacteria bacterium]|nr:(2Fe-2S)-binding protein [Gammaproteobacteria bacterium]